MQVKYDSYSEALRFALVPHKEVDPFLDHRDRPDEHALADYLEEREDPRAPVIRRDLEDRRRKELGEEQPAGDDRFWEGEHHMVRLGGTGNENHDLWFVPLYPNHDSAKPTRMRVAWHHNSGLTATHHYREADFNPDEAREIVNRLPEHLRGDAHLFLHAHFGGHPATNS